MGRGHPVYPLPVEPGKAGVAQRPGFGFPAGRRGQALLSGAEHPQGHPQPGALGPHKGLVGVGRGAPQPVVHMAGRHPDPQRASQIQQQPQQGHTVRPARHGCRHLLARSQQPGLPAKRQHPVPGPMQGLFFFGHINA